MKKRTSLLLPMFISLLIACAIVAWVGGTMDAARVFTDPSQLWKRIIWPLIRLSLLISVGLFAGQVIEGMGWTNRLSVMARPFMRWGHLSHEMGAVFTTAFFSGTTALSMLMAFYQEGKLNRREITLAVLLNTFPSFFLHFPTTFFVIFPLVGKAGVIYLLLTFGAALLRMGAILSWTRFTLPESEGYVREKSQKIHSFKRLISETGRKFKRRITRVLVIVIPVYVLMVFISDMGFFLFLRKWFASSFSSFFVPVEAMSMVMLSLVAEFTSGYATAGAMLHTGTLNVFQTVLALLLGNIVAAPVRAIRHQLPYYMGIFKPALGVRLMVLTQAFRVSSLMVMGLMYYLLMLE
ncbi:transporter gate domain protein [delta proteobacterium NaphS2]|nr:transporter gate domain protein [delta proteobacterium NaphS2]